MNVVEPIRNKETVDAVKRVLRENGTRDLLLFLMGINTGLRVSDLLNLKIQDVRGKDFVQIREKKTNKTKRFPLPRGMKIFIGEYIRNHPPYWYLFRSRKNCNRPISRVQAYRIITNACNLIGLEHVGTHTLRKTFGYHFYKQTKDIAMLQKILNHSSQDITLRYIGVTQEVIEDSLKLFTL